MSLIFKIILFVLKAIFLYIAIRWSFVTIIHAIYKDSIPGGNFIISAIGITGFIMLQFSWVF
jgi:hypothetical protein